MRLRIICIFCCVCLMSVISLGQQSCFKNERRIYLWDVTQSMKGFQGKTPAIYDDVVAALEKDINSIKDEQTDIWVLPFQTDTIETWHVQATSIGKKDVIRKIRGFEDGSITNTNIAVPMKKVMDSLISPDRRNVLILLTDGIQNVKSNPTLIELIQQWCSFAEKNDAYAFYVMLTQYAQDAELIKAIDETCRMSKVDGVVFNFVELLPQYSCKYNIKDDLGKKLSLQIDCKKQVTIPNNLKIHCYCDANSYIEVDQTTQIKNGRLNLSIRPKLDYETLKSILPQDYNEEIGIHFEIEEPDKYPLVQLLNNECTLELINKPEKTLKVYVKD